MQLEAELSTTKAITEAKTEAITEAKTEAITGAEAILRWKMDHQIEMQRKN